jgi:hypothetical protein
MLKTLIYAGVLICLGVIVTRPSAIIPRLVGVPALWLGNSFPRRPVVLRIALVAAVVTELYVILAFASWLTTWAKWLLAKHPDLCAPPLIRTSLLVAILPPSLIWLSTISPPDEEGSNGEQISGCLFNITRTAKLAPICVIALAFVSPSMLVRLWPWTDLGLPSRSMEVVLLFSGLVWALYLSWRFPLELPVLKGAFARLIK